MIGDLKMCLKFYKGEKDLEKRFIKAMRSALFTGKPVELKGFGRFNLVNRHGILEVVFVPEHELLLYINDSHSTALN